MAWWKIHEQTGVIGDGGADIITQLGKDVNTLYRSSQLSPPDFGEFLRVLKEECNEAIDAELIIGETSIQGLMATYHNSDEKTFDSDLPDQLLTELRSLIKKGINDVSEDYLQFLDRKATIIEVFACFSFVLGYKPEYYLSGMEEKSVARIEQVSPLVN